MDITKESTNRSGVTEGEEEPFCRIKNDRVAFRQSVTENREKGLATHNTATPTSNITITQHLSQAKASYGTLPSSSTSRNPKTETQLQSSEETQLQSSEETQLKTSIFYHISNPIVRWRADHARPPYKMIVELLKMAALVVQVALLVEDPVSNYSNFQGEIQDVFSNLLCQTNPHIVPKIRGNPYNTYTYNLYTASDLEYIFDRVDNILFPNLSTLLGAYNYSYGENGTVRPIEISLTQYSQGVLCTVQKPFQCNGAPNTTYSTLTPDGSKSIFQQFLGMCGREDCFQRLKSMEVRFFLTNVRMLQPEWVQCFGITIKLSVVSEGGGRLQLTLLAAQQCTECDDQMPYQSAGKNCIPSYEGWNTETFFCFVVFVLCVISLVLALNALRKSCKLAKAMGRFYHQHLNLPLTWSQRAPLFEYWHFINIISDLVILPGTIINFLFDLLHTCDMLSHIETVRILLGIGTVLQAAVILRYTSYFKQFNMLSCALDVAFPRLVKFLVCVGILFMSFMLCGWAVLGPFHYKFSDYDVSFYTLFSTLNGDDLWNTFTGMTTYDNKGIFIFSQIFFIVFLILFIYAILNLFVSLIIQSYEESQLQEPHLKDEVQKFVFSGPLMPGGVALKDVIPTALYVSPEVVKRQEPPCEVKVSDQSNTYGDYL
ncbi:hypothetical protein EMCRGX_G031178 [Ephydatia muelleri]